MEKLELIEENANKILVAKELKEMMSTKGWKHVVNFIEDSKQRLLASPHEDMQILDRFNVYTILNDFVKRLDDMVEDAEVAIESNNKLK